MPVSEWRFLRHKSSTVTCFVSITLTSNQVPSPAEDSAPPEHQQQQSPPKQQRAGGPGYRRLSEREFPLEMGGTKVSSEKPQQLRPRGGWIFSALFFCRSFYPDGDDLTCEVANLTPRNAGHSVCGPEVSCLPVYPRLVFLLLQYSSSRLGFACSPSHANRHRNFVFSEFL